MRVASLSSGLTHMLPGLAFSFPHSLPSCSMRGSRVTGGKTEERDLAGQVASLLTQSGVSLTRPGPSPVQSHPLPSPPISQPPATLTSSHTLTFTTHFPIMSVHAIPPLSNALPCPHLQ